MACSGCTCRDRGGPAITTDVCIHPSIAGSLGKGQGTENHCVDIDSAGKLCNWVRTT
jgi:hypothetical protein